MRKTAAVAYAIVLTVGASGCGSSTEPPATTGSIAASVNGVPLVATRANATLIGAGNFIIANFAEPSQTQVTLRLSSVGKPGTYPLGVSLALVGGLGDVSIGGATYTTPASGDAGSVTLTTVTTTRIAGTFTFTAERLTFSGPERVTVTGGTFDAAVTGGGTLEIPENVGSSVTGTVRGASFMATSIAVSQAPASGTLTMRLRQGSNDIALNLPGIAGVGAYPFNALAARTLKLDAPIGEFFSTWGGTNASTSGTVTITALTAARVKGTIAATLTPTFAPLNTPPAAIALTFDVALP